MASTTSTPPRLTRTAVLARRARSGLRGLGPDRTSAALLLLGAAAALVWVNSPWRAAYEALWVTPVGARVGGARLDLTLHALVNDALMAVFFFLAVTIVIANMFIFLMPANALAEPRAQAAD